MVKQFPANAHKSFVVWILTPKLFDIKILQTLFADPAPVKTFREWVGGGTPEKDA